MDKRTIKIRELESKLIRARIFIRELAMQCVRMEDGKTLSKSYWGVGAITSLEDTKPNSNPF